MGRDGDRAPFFAALQAQAGRSQTPFYFPGHKQGAGIAPPFRDWLGETALRGDLPELPQLDNLFAPEQSLRDAQDLAAAAFGASQTWFTTNGSTAGVLAAILATCAPGTAIVLPRNLHQCALSAVVLSGARPVFLSPEFDRSWNLARGLSVEAISAALERELAARNPVGAVFVLSPTYHGICSDLRAIADLCHRHDIPLIVDEAHGAHLAFHPDLPPSALECGADVVVQSTHKSLTALSQAAMLHRRGDRVAGDRLAAALALVQSTSPNALLLASLDVARWQMATRGRQQLQRLLDWGRKLRSRLAAVPGLAVYPHADDPTRLTVRVAGRSGYDADEWLDREFGVVCELPQLHHLTFALSVGNSAADGDRLVAALSACARSAPPAVPLPTLALPPLPPLRRSPREAFFAPKERVRREDSCDRICGETLCPYPPGIPLLMPGEHITAEALAYLDAVLAAGATVTGAADATGATLSVLKRNPERFEPPLERRQS